MNRYFYPAILLTTIASFGWLAVAIAKDRVSPEDNNPTQTKKAPNVSKAKKAKVVYNPDFTQVIHRNVHQELNAIAQGSLVSAVLDGKLKQKQPPKPSPIKVASKTLEIVKEAEGFRSLAYIDTDGTPVIGYGQSRIQGKKVKIGDRISVVKAHAALHEDLEIIQSEILSSVTVDLNNNQLSALTSLAFNTGVDRVKKSTLLRKLNQKNYLGAANEFIRWDKANIRGKLVKMEGLSRRRSKERSLFLTPTEKSIEYYPDRIVALQPAF